MIDRETDSESDRQIVRQADSVVRKRERKAKETNTVYGTSND